MVNLIKKRFFFKLVDFILSMDIYRHYLVNPPLHRGLPVILCYYYSMDSCPI